MEPCLSLQIYEQPARLIELTIEEMNAHHLVVIPEDVAFEFVIRCPIQWGEPIIELGDIPIKVIVQDQGPTASFYIARGRHVENHFGQCLLRLHFAAIDQWFQPVIFNVFARKANALQAEAILQHLSKNGDDILRFCFSKTQFGADHKKSEHQDPSLILQHAESVIKFLAKSRGYLRNHYRSRLVRKNSISPRDERASIDDTTVSWLFQNLDQLSASDRMDFDVAINGMKYRLSNIHHSPLTEDTNVFENKVVLSLLWSIKERLTKYLREASVVKLSSDDPLPGYVSFDLLLSKIFPITGFWTNKCEELIAETNTLIMFVQRSIPCEKIHDLRPTVTPFVRGNNVYRQIFNLAHQWYELGVPSWSGQEYIISLMSLPKLYEFFCLTAMLETFSTLNFKFASKDFRLYEEYADVDGASSSRPSSAPYNYYSLTRGEINIELFYEPKIWSFQDFSENKRLIDISHARNGKWAYRMPDFLVRVSDQAGSYKYLIFDAKYSSPKIICEHHLPALVDKYLLGIGVVDTHNRLVSQAPMLGVFSFHPNPSTEAIAGTSSVLTPKHLNKRFGPLQNLVLPSVASIELAPLRKSEFGSVLERLLENI